MKTINTLLKVTSVMLLAIALLTACSKSASAPENQVDNPGTFPLFSPANSNIGSIHISKEQEGNARVVVVLDKSVLQQFQPPFSLKLIGSTLPTADLQPLNNDGVSETYPVLSSNKGLLVSYDALMYMKDLQLQVTDAQNRMVTLSDVH